MGSCDSFMVASAGLVTENLYKPLIRGRSDRHYLIVARLSGLIAVAGGVAIAFASEGVVPLLENLWKINTMMAMAFWLGIFWRRATVAGAWAATIAAVSVWWITTQTWTAQLLAGLPAADLLGLVRDRNDTLTIWIPWQMVFYITAGFAAGILVSLFTRPIDDDRLDRFYEVLRTPASPGETVAEPCTLPEGVQPAPRRVFFPQTSLEIPIPGRTAIAGFAAGWACVVGIISAVAFGIAE